MLGELVGELNFRMTGSQQVQLVEGTSGSREKSSQIVLDAGINMLGHSIVLRRDSNVANQGNFRIAVVPAAAHDGGAIQIEFSPFPRNLRCAFVPHGGPFNANWGGNAPLVDDHMELYADYDVLATSDLQLGLDSANDGGYGVATDSNRRLLLPGYTMASVGGPLSTGVTGAQAVLAFPQRKRRRVGEVDDPALRGEGESAPEGAAGNRG